VIKVLPSGQPLSLSRVARARRELGERLRRGTDAGDEVERAGQQLKSYKARDLGNLLVAVAVPAKTFDVGVADLGRRREDLLREGHDRGDFRLARRALAGDLDLAADLMS
jgi:hypothetical protein